MSLADEFEAAIAGIQGLNLQLTNDHVFGQYWDDRFIGRGQLYDRAINEGTNDTKISGYVVGIKQY